MLKHIYGRLIAFHPECFRSQFGDEMLSIFDQAQTRSARLRLIADAVISLIRQWGFRPQFWQEPVVQKAVPAGAAPEFIVFENFRPRTGALIDGALLSAVVFTIVCFAMGYAWNHPVLIHIVQPYWKISRGHVVTEMSATHLSPPAPLGAESPVYTSEGRVVLVFPSARVTRSADAAVLPQLASVAGATLASYVGTYRTERGQQVIVKLTGTEFGIQEAALPTIVLTPISDGRSLSAVRNATIWCRSKLTRLGLSIHSKSSGVVFAFQHIANNGFNQQPQPDCSGRCETKSHAWARPSSA
jgi:hypothetical protein